MSFLDKLFGNKDKPAPEPEAEGPLTLKQKELVQGSWEKCIPIADTAAELFYGRLPLCLRHTIVVQRHIDAAWNFSGRATFPFLNFVWIPQV